MNKLKKTEALGFIRFESFPYISTGYWPNHPDQYKGSAYWSISDVLKGLFRMKHGFSEMFHPLYIQNVGLLQQRPFVVSPLSLPVLTSRVSLLHGFAISCSSISIGHYKHVLHKPS